MIGQDRQAKKGIGKLSAAPLHFTKFGRLVQTPARPELQLIDWWIGKQPGIQVTDRGACGPWRDGGRANCDRSSWPCARESRECGHDANYWD